MGFGKKNPDPPKPEDPIPVPQEDDPSSLKTKQDAAREAKRRRGYSAHSLTTMSDQGAVGNTVQNKKAASLG